MGKNGEKWGKMGKEFYGESILRLAIFPIFPHWLPPFLSRYGMKPSTVEISTQTEGAEIFRVKSITPICVDTNSAKKNTCPPGNGEGSRHRVERANIKFVLAMRKGMHENWEEVKLYNRPPVERLGQFLLTLRNVWRPSYMRSRGCSI